MTWYSRKARATTLTDNLTWYFRKARATTLADNLTWYSRKSNRLYLPDSLALDLRPGRVDAAGLISDRTGNGYDAQLYGTPTAYFNGDDSASGDALSGLTPDTVVTVDFAVDASSATGVMTLVANAVADDDADSVVVAVAVDASRILTVSSSFGSVDVSRPTSALPDGVVWLRAVVTHDGTDTTIRVTDLTGKTDYTDGQDYGTTGATSLDDDQLILGNGGTSSDHNPLIGYLWRVHIANGNETLASYLLNHGVDGQLEIPDRSGNGHTLSIVGTSWVDDIAGPAESNLRLETRTTEQPTAGYSQIRSDDMVSAGGEMTLRYRLYPSASDYIIYRDHLRIRTLSGTLYCDAIDAEGGTERLTQPLPPDRCLDVVYTLTYDSDTGECTAALYLDGVQVDTRSWSTGLSGSPSILPATNRRSPHVYAGHWIVPAALTSDQVWQWYTGAYDIAAEHPTTIYVPDDGSMESYLLDESETYDYSEQSDDLTHATAHVPVYAATSRTSRGLVLGPDVYGESGAMDWSPTAALWAWVRKPTLCGDDHIRIIDTNTTGSGVRLELTADGEITAELDDGTNVATATISGLLDWESDEWLLAGMEWDESTGEVTLSTGYRGGTLETATDTNASITALDDDPALHWWTEQAADDGTVTGRAGYIEIGSHGLAPEADMPELHKQGVYR